MAMVYLCEHIHMRRRVALKILPVAQAANPASVERFHREARAVAALNHPNIVRAFDVDRHGRLHFLAMEYVEGASLQEIVSQRGRWACFRRSTTCTKPALGLQHAYENGLIHRDIKPSNLLVDLTGTVKILDLGLARFFLDESDDLSAKHQEHILGTADYLAPEQAIHGRQTDIRSDLYSLGCTFYFCLTGQRPFPDGTPAHKIVLHQSRQPRPVRDLRPEVPRELAAIIDRAMAKRPEKRYQTPQELADALAGLSMMTSETAVNRADRTLREARKTAEKHWWRRQMIRAAIGFLVGGGPRAIAALRRQEGSRKVENATENEGRCRGIGAVVGRYFPVGPASRRSYFVQDRRDAGPTRDERRRLDRSLVNPASPPRDTSAPHRC